MGYMDLLKGVMGMSGRETQEINEDNKHYKFTPGPNGSLTSDRDDTGDKPLVETRPPVAKTVPMKPSQDVSVETAATRG